MAKTNLKGTVSLDDSAFSAGVRRVKMASASLARTVGSGFSKIGGAVTKVSAQLTKLATIAASITFAAATAATAKLLKSSVGLASNYEQIEVKMTAFLRDAGKAEKILQEISEFSVVTPFETTGLQEAAALLLGAGINGEQVVDVLKEIAAVSKDTGQVSELADALSKGFAKGKFQTEELNKFLERGINLMPELAKVTGKTGEELQKAIQKGLGFDDVRKAIAAMSAEGGLFFGMLEKQSKTFAGQISTLSSNWDELRMKIGKPVKDALIPYIEKAILKLQEWNNIDFSGIGERLIAGMNIENLQKILKGTFALAAAYFADRIVFGIAKAMEMFGRMWDKFISVKIDAFTNGLKQGLITAMNPVSLVAGITHAGKTLTSAAEEGGESFANTILSVLDGEDPFGVAKAAEDLKKIFADIVAANKEPEPAPTPAAASSAGNAPFADGKVYADSPEGKALQAGFAKAVEEQRSKIALSLPTPMSLKDAMLQEYGMKASESAAAGFRGLAGLYGMQQESLLGLDPGSNNRFANDRKRLGIASGLSTGGLGDARKVGAAAAAKSERRDSTLGTTNQRLSTANDLLAEQTKILKQGLN